MALVEVTALIQALAGSLSQRNCTELLLREACVDFFFANE
jgi:hypothetical protein